MSSGADSSDARPVLRFDRGHTYSRPDIKELAGLSREAQGGNWDTGVVEHDGQFLIFANVGTGGRTGHEYGNRWEQGRLRWSHKNGSTLAWKSVQRLLSGTGPVHVFWRSSNSESFTYAGIGTAEEMADTSPVELLWSFGGEPLPFPFVREPQEIAEREFTEGTVRQVLVNAYERDRAAREACLKHHGTKCSVCELSFEARYGALGAGFIHVHHLVPLASVGQEYRLDPVEDLRPVCPNCHAMLHRRRPPLSITELRDQLVPER